MREISVIVWLALVLLLPVRSETIVDGMPDMMGDIRFNKISDGGYAKIDISGRIENTDEVREFIINGIPVRMHDKLFQHRVFLRDGRQPLVFRISNGFNSEERTFVAVHNKDKDFAEEIRRVRKNKNKYSDFTEDIGRNFEPLIEKDPYNIKLHREYVEAMMPLIDKPADQVKRVDVILKEIKSKYEEWFLDESYLGSADLPNVCLIFFLGYAYELGGKWDLARIKYEETLWLDKYFAPAHLGMAKYYKHKWQSDKKALDYFYKALDHCELANRYNYNDAFYIKKDISEFYSNIMEENKDEGVYANAYLSRALLHPAETIKARIDDVTKKQKEFSTITLAKAYLSILRRPINLFAQAFPKLEDELSSRVNMLEPDKVKGLPDSQEKVDICSILGNYYQQKSEQNAADRYYKYALASQYKLNELSRGEEEDKREKDYDMLYFDAIIQLRKERDETRGKALMGKADKLQKGAKDLENYSKAASLLREALLCFRYSMPSDETKKHNIEEITRGLETIYEKYNI